MYDADYENYLEELREEAAEQGLFVTRDSGKKAKHSDGVVRDTEEGKTKFTLMFPKGVPMDQQLIVRIAELYTRGGDRYGDRNWENSKSEDSLAHHTDALWRHFMEFFFDTQASGEDHAAAIVWNINAVELCRRNLKEAEIPNPFPERLMAGEEVVKASVPNDGCGKGLVASTPLENDYDAALRAFKSYIFPYIGKDTAATGMYYQKEILAENYTAAKELFDAWLSKQPSYNTATLLHPDPVPAADLKWSEGDVLEEVKQALDGKPYTWVYSAPGDIWLYTGNGDDSSYTSARSFSKLRAEFGPLKCTKGSHTGRIVDGA